MQKPYFPVNVIFKKHEPEMVGVKVSHVKFGRPAKTVRALKRKRTPKP